jgi:hypothetical protein
MTRIIKDKAISITLNKYSVFALAFMVLSCIVLYIYFANSAVRIVTTLQKTKSEMQNLNMMVSELEAKRLALDDKLNMENAKNLGFIQVRNQAFIVNKNTKTAYSY